MAVVKSGIGPGISMYGNEDNWKAADVNPEDGNLSLSEILVTEWPD